VTRLFVCETFSVCFPRYRLREILPRAATFKTFFGHQPLGNLFDFGGNDFSSSRQVSVKIEKE